MLTSVGKYFLVKGEEIHQVAFFLLLFFVVGAGLALGRGTTDALFFKRYGVEYLPIMYLILAVLLMAVTMIYAAFADRVPAERLFKIFFISIFLLLISNWLMIVNSVSELAFPIYFLLFEVASDLLILHFGVYISHNFETLQAKRILPLIFGGAQLGTIVGGVLLMIIVPFLGVPNILLLWAMLLLLAIGLLYFYHRKKGVSPFFRPGRKSGTKFNQAISQITQGIKYSKRSELIRFSSVALFFTVIMFYILSYSVNRVYAETFTSEESLTAFFGMLAAVTSLIALVLQFFLTNKMLQKFGVRTVNLIFPVTSLASYLLLLVSFSLPSAIFGSINKDSIMKAFRNPVRNLLFNALPNYMQGRARALAAGLVIPLGLGFAGLFLIVSQHFETPTYFLLIGLCASLAYFYFNSKTNRAYVKGMIDVLHEKLFLPDQPNDEVYKGVGNELLQDLCRGVQHPNDELSVAYAKKLVSLFYHHSSDIILTRHKTAGNSARDQLIKLLLPLNPPTLTDALWGCLDTNDEHFKATILEWFFKRRDEKAVSLVETALKSVNPRIIAAGIYGVHTYSLHRLFDTANQKWVELLSSKNSNLNCAGIELLIRYPDVKYQNYILKLLDSGQQRVRKKVLEALTNWPESIIPELTPILNKLFQDPDYKIRLSCVICCRLIPESARVELLSTASEDTHSSVRQAAAGVLSHGYEQAVSFLSDWIMQNRGSVRSQEAALNVLFKHQPPREMLERLAIKKAEDAQIISIALDLIRNNRHTQKSPAIELMEFALNERLHQSIDLALNAFEYVEDPATIRTIRLGLRSGDKRYVANASEAVRHIGHKKLAKLLTELLDSFGTIHVVQTGNVPHFRTLEDMLGWFVKCKDPWLQDCAGYALSNSR